ncbi:MAG: SpoIIE family protein phosphatase [Desulfococcaceae bacterium]
MNLRIFITEGTESGRLRSIFESPERFYAPEDNLFLLHFFENIPDLLRCVQEEFLKDRPVPLCILQMPLEEGEKTAESLFRIDPDIAIILIFPSVSFTPRKKMGAWERHLHCLSPPLRDDAVSALAGSMLMAWNEKQKLKSLVREAELRENGEYLKTIMSVIQTGVMIIDPQNYKIIDANPCASRMLGCGENELIGRDFYELRDREGKFSDPRQRMVSDEYALKRHDNRVIHVRRTLTGAKVKGREYLVQSMLDITDIRRLMNKMEISIDLARHLLHMVNGQTPRHTELPENRVLFAEALSFPCNKEGGDHFFVRNFPDMSVFSLKDQSGHEVGCVLRSIITDLIHHSLLNRFASKGQDFVISHLNGEICRSGMFRSHDFFTAVSAQIDHRTLEMKYVSAGHPRFLLIRGDRVTGLPERDGAGKNLFIPLSPETVFSAGICPLQDGDRLIFYTDGLTEMPRTNGLGFITFDRLLELTSDILRSEQAVSAADLMRKIIEKVCLMSRVDPVFSKNTSLDDITLLGLEIENTGRCREKILYPENADALYKMIDDLYREISQEMNWHGYEISPLGIRSILSESILNAWRHGNRGDSSKSITVRWRFGNDFHLEVKDEGSGFDSGNIPDPKSGDFFYRNSGRGVYIIRRYADTVQWKDRGRHMMISMRKHREAAGQEYARQTANTMKLW